MQWVSAFIWKERGGGAPCSNDGQMRTRDGSVKKRLRIMVAPEIGLKVLRASTEMSQVSSSWWGLTQRATSSTPHLTVNRNCSMS